MRDWFHFNKANNLKLIAPPERVSFEEGLN